MTERLTWEQIQKKYPNQWVGLVDVRYRNNDGISVEFAVVKYVDKTKSELTRMVLKGEMVSRHTNPEGHLQLGGSGDHMKRFILKLDDKIDDCRWMI